MFDKGTSDVSGENGIHPTGSKNKGSIQKTFLIGPGLMRDPGGRGGG